MCFAQLKLKQYNWYDDILAFAFKPIYCEIINIILYKLLLSRFSVLELTIFIYSSTKCILMIIINNILLVWME